MTAATPIKMPSVVRAERVLLRVNALRATESVRGKNGAPKSGETDATTCDRDRGAVPVATATPVAGGAVKTAAAG